MQSGKYLKKMQSDNYAVDRFQNKVHKGKCQYRDREKSLKFRAKPHLTVSFSSAKTQSSSDVIDTGFPKNTK